MRIVLLFVFAICSTFKVFSQPINAYAKVTGITVVSGRARLDISNLNETNGTFAVGEDVIVMQMQDNVLGDNTNSSTFGDIGSILSAGAYEVKTVNAINGGRTQITLNTTLVNTYNTAGANTSVQIISFTEVANRTISGSDITAVPWDGNVGGVIAINVTTDLRLNTAGINADGAGFRGGAVNTGTNGGACNTTTYKSTASDVVAEKGEGIFKRSAGDQQYGRGKIINGGGGGNLHNAGGGGGGNYETGALGGSGFGCATSAGGLGGISLKNYISASRIFMGGGGGGGHQNNGVGSSGGRGGGIILIKADRIRNIGGSCTTQSISANGLPSPNTSANDGAGGGGAGGTIILDLRLYQLTCAITVSANGGNGGSVNDAAVHGGGGGGAQGRIIYKTAPSAGMVNSTNNGSSGCSATPCPTGITPPAPTGSNGGGISSGGGTPLPVELLYFTGSVNTNNKFVLNWATAVEQNNQYFTLERSVDGEIFEPVTEVTGKGNTSLVSKYSYEDKNGFERAYYYRLSQVDNDGTMENLKVIYLTRDGQNSPELWLYPNPANPDKVTLDFVHMEKGAYKITIMNMQGGIVRQREIEISDAFLSTEYNLDNLATGIYTLQLTPTHASMQGRIIKKLVVK